MTDKAKRTSLELLPAGFDLGNGMANLSVLGKTVSIPVGYCNHKPTNQLTQSGSSKSKAFRVSLGDDDYWLGPDILANNPIRKVDSAKYSYPDYIKIMFSACVVSWDKKYGKTQGIDIFKHRLCVVTGMPPELFRDATTKRIAQAAYAEELKNEKHETGLETPWYVGSDWLETRRRVHVEFLGVEAEALIYQQQKGLDKNCYTIFCDVGYGTVDLLAFNHQGRLLAVKSFNLGMLHCYNDVNNTRPHLAELDFFNGDGDTKYLESHFSQVENKVLSAARLLDTKGLPINLIVMGGATKIMPNGFKAGIKANFNTVTYLNGDTNALCFEQSAAKRLAEKSAAKEPLGQSAVKLSV